MLDTAISKTIGCQFGFKCLNKRSNHPFCPVIGSDGENVLSVSNDTDTNCRYRGGVGKRQKCTCPTHYALHNKHPYMNRSLRLGREVTSPERSQPRDGQAIPKTLEDAVQMLIAELSLKDKLSVAHMSVEEIGESALCLINYIRDAFHLESGNNELLRSCSKDAGCDAEHPDDAAAIILARLVIKLEKMHNLRAV